MRESNGGCFFFLEIKDALAGDEWSLAASSRPEETLALCHNRNRGRDLYSSSMLPAECF